MRLPMAIVRPKRKAEPPDANGHAAEQPAKKREAEDGIGTTAGLGTAQAGSPAVRTDSEGGAAGLGGLADYGSDSA